MIDFREPAGHDAPGDPLERIVEGFVGQSAPDGPDAVTRRRLLAAMAAADRAPLKAAGPANAARPRHESRTASARAAGDRSWATFAGLQLLGLAAALALIASGAWLAASLRNIDRATTDADVRALVGNFDVPSGAAADPSVPNELVRVVESYLRTHGNQPPNREAVKSLIADLLRDNPRLAEVDSWRVAQERLADALEQPEVYGLGVGLLGTLPWTTHGRF